MPKNRVTITELAKELNTTPATVSRALNGNMSISQSMRERVLELAQKRKYTVNRMASSLASGNSKTIGVIVPRVNRDFFSNCISGIEEIASKAGYSILISQTHDDIEKEQKCINTFIESNIAGIIISTGSKTDNLDYFKEINRLNIPLIFFDRATKNPKQNKVILDDKLGAYQGTIHLIEQGYQRIAHFAGPQDIQIYRRRLKGYKQALKDNNIPLDKDLIIEVKRVKDEGYNVMGKLMKMPNPPDALLCASAYSALGAIIKLKELKIDIPKDMGVVGFSNELFTSIISPTMTIIDQFSKKMGRAAATACIETINEKGKTDSYKKIVIKPNLIIRESSMRKK